MRKSSRFASGFNNHGACSAYKHCRFNKSLNAASVQKCQRYNRRYISIYTNAIDTSAHGHNTQTEPDLNNIS